MSVYSRPIFDSAELLSTHCLRLKITVFWLLFCWRTNPERAARLNNKLSPIHLPGRMSLKVSVYNLILGLFECFCALFIIVNLIVFVHFSYLFSLVCSVFGCKWLTAWKDPTPKWRVISWWLKTLNPTQISDSLTHSLAEQIWKKPKEMILASKMDYRWNADKERDAEWQHTGIVYQKPGRVSLTDGRGSHTSSHIVSMQL